MQNQHLLSHWQRGLGASLFQLLVLFCWHRCIADAQNNSLDDGDQTGFIQSLNQNFDVILQEIRALRAEQTELRQQLEKCGCGVSSKGTLAEEPQMAMATNGEGAVVQNVNQGEGTGALVNIDISDTPLLKKVLFGGEPWIIYCKDGKGRRQIPPSILEESAMQLQNLANFGTLDCWERTSSGKTLAHRFNFPKPPVVFAVANGDAPLVVDLERMRKPWHLRRKVQSHLQATVARIDSPKKFKSFCTSRRACLVVGYKTAPLLAEALQMLNPLLERHRGIRAVAVDTAVWKVQLDKNFTATKPKKSKEQKDHADIVCITHQLGANPWNGAFFSMVKEALSDGEGIDEFLDNCDTGNGLIRISRAPKISLRPSDQPKPYSPPRSKSISKKNDSSIKNKMDSPSPSSSNKKGRKQEIPRFHPMRDKKESKKNKDHVGSRNRLEKEEEPLFSSVDDDGEDSTWGSEEELNDDDAEEVEL